MREESIPIAPEDWENKKTIDHLKNQYSDLMYRISNLERLIVKMMAMKEKES